MKTVFNALNFNSWVGEPKLAFGLYRNSIAKIWGKIKVFGLRCCISPQRFLFYKQTLALSKCTLFGGATIYIYKKRQNLLHYFLSELHTGSISMKYQQIRCVVTGVKGRWNHPPRQDFSLHHRDGVVVAVVGRKHSCLSLWPLNCACSTQPW